MDDEASAFGENESPFLFSPTATRRKSNTNKTYRRSAQYHINNKNKNKNKRRRSGSEKVPLPTTPPPPKPWTPVEVKRCALQTLGGSSGNPSPAPLKGDALHKTRSTKTTLRKMKPYGGRMFYDKCYLSSDDEREAEQVVGHSWALSPATDADEISFSPTAEGATPSKKSLRLTSAGKGKRARRVSGEHSVFMPPVEEETESESGVDTDDDAFAEPRSETSRRPATPRARNKNDDSPAPATGQEGGGGTTARSASSGARRRGRASYTSSKSSKPSSKQSFTHQVR